MLKADLHLHTTFSPDSTVTPAKLVARCQKRGINCLAVTEHNNMEGSLAVQRMAPFKVVSAEEMKTTEGELIGYFLKEAIPGGLSPEETVRRIKEQGGLVCLPHPFDRTRREPLRAAARERILTEIDIVEAFNSRTTLARDNATARRFAERLGLPMSAGSDAHSLGEVGNACVEMPDFETPAEFLEALRRGKITAHRSLPLVHLISTWAKIRNRSRRRAAPL
ncbi:MAG: PHP domain-containing protein [Dehalococcoidia bacterium]|jgi:predicted metal-dependent phosphoesterase TrpH